MTAGEWDTHEWRIYHDLIADGVAEDNARALAEIETTVQFGDRPDEETAK